MAGRARELSGVAEDGERPQVRFAAARSRAPGWLPGPLRGVWQWARRKYEEDPDITWAYETYKTVRIKDGRLGLLYWMLILIICLYIVIRAFHIDRRHQEADPGVGTVMIEVTGKAYAKGDKTKVFDITDLRFPAIEPSGAFIMTRQVVMKDQSRTNCVDWDNPEPCPCSTEGVVCNAGYCENPGWCPSIGDGNIDDPPALAEVTEVEGLENLLLHLHAGIAFPFAGNYFYVAAPGPGQPSLKNLSLGSLLSYADPPMTISDVVETGALIGVNLLWSCELSSFKNFRGDLGEVPTGLGEETQYCPYYFAVSRLDGGQGFAQKRSRHKRANGQETRDAIYTAGLRIIVDSSGLGRRTSLVLIAIQIGSMFSLLKVASLITDRAMVGFPCLPERLRPVMRKNYERCKVEETDDASDLRDRITQVDQEKRDFQANLRKAGRVPVTDLGLGAGGRGGSGAAVLRGRR